MYLFMCTDLDYVSGIKDQDQQALVLSLREGS